MTVQRLLLVEAELTVQKTQCLLPFYFKQELLCSKKRRMRMF